MNHWVSRSGFIIPAEPIDVAAWPEDDQFAQYPEGARPKTAFFPPQLSPPSFVNPSRRQLFKRSANRFPDQFWAEIVAYHIGCLMGIEVPPAFPAVHSQAGQSGSLIEWFYEDGESVFVMGGQFMQQVIPEFDQRRGTQHNFHTVQVLFRSFQRVELVANDWLPSWVRTFLFDAVCGNTDRHQNNWGLLADDVGTLRRFRLSPCYDNGTSLGHELNETHHGGWNETQFQAYIRRGRHHMKWAQGDPKGVQHLDLITRLATLSKASVHEAVEAHVWRMDLGELEEGLNRLCSLQIPIPLTSWRAGLILRLVKLRRAQLLEALK